MEVESVCKKMAEDWIDGGCGPNLFEVSISTICGYIDEKREGATCLSVMANTWWLNGGNSQEFVENTDLILKLIKEGK